MQFTKKDLDIVFKYVTERLIREKLSDFPDAEVLTGREIIPVIQGGENRNMKTKNILDIPQVSDKFSSCDSKLENKAAELQNQIDSLEIAGVAVSNEFGSNSHIGVSQKTLTEAFNKLWQKIEDMTGEQIQGIQMVVTPEYFISEDGCTVHITANTVETNGVFEHIAFYINGELIAEADNTDLFEYETSISETSVIKCVAKIMGIEYMQQKVVTHYNSFWLGAGSVYTDIMDVDHVIPITNGMRGAYDVEVADGQRIIIIVGDALKDGFLRADLNSVEIPFTETSVTVDGKGYRVYMSEPWNAGSYNIDING